MPDLLTLLAVAASMGICLTCSSRSVLFSLVGDINDACRTGCSRNFVVTFTSLLPVEVVSRNSDGGETSGVFGDSSSGDI